MTTKIHNRYNPEDDAGKVTWADEELSNEIDRLNARCDALLKEIESAHALIGRLFNTIDHIQNRMAQR